MPDLFTLRDRAQLLIDFLRAHPTDAPVVWDGVRTTVLDVVRDQLEAAGRAQQAVLVRVAEAAARHLAECGLGEPDVRHALQTALAEWHDQPAPIHPRDVWPAHGRAAGQRPPPDAP